jgi:DNA-binding NarL/FixJ family response regulator
MQRMRAAVQSCDSRLPHPGIVRRLVIVADNSLIIESIRIGFRESGEFKLVGYADPRRTSAQAILGAEPDAILFDDLGRSEDAIELLREIKNHDPELVVLMLCMNLDPESLDELFNAGASAAISKATSPRALVTLVRETLSGHIVHSPQTTRPSTYRSSAATAPGGQALTDRELEILQLVASGATNGEIARRLWVAEQTVKFHLRNVYRKLDVANRTQASHFAHINGLVTLASASEPSSKHKLQIVS